MTRSYVFYGLAVLLGVLIPLVPQLVRLRITVLRKLHLTRLADFHERHLGGLTWFIRGILAVAAIVALWLAAGGTSVGS
jgi:hypothetical protein